MNVKSLSVAWPKLNPREILFPFLTLTICWYWFSNAGNSFPFPGNGFPIATWSLMIYFQSNLVTLFFSKPYITSPLSHMWQITDNKNNIIKGLLMCQARCEAHKDVVFPKSQPFQLQLHHHSSYHPWYHFCHSLQGRVNMNTSQYNKILQLLLERYPSGGDRTKEKCQYFHGAWEVVTLELYLENFTEEVTL